MNQTKIEKSDPLALMIWITVLATFLILISTLITLGADPSNHHYALVALALPAFIFAATAAVSHARERSN